jgi:pilus assembly protein CpaE
MTSVLETLLQTFAVVIVDGGSVVDDRLVGALERADDVLIVVSPDFPALKSVHAMFDYLRERGTTIPEPTIVLNELFAREMLTIADIEGALLKKVAVRIPYDPELYLRAVNEGTPVLVAAPASPPARRIDQLATLLVGVDAPEAPLPRRRGVLGALLGRS